MKPEQKIPQMPSFSESKCFPLHGIDGLKRVIVPNRFRNESSDDTNPTEMWVGISTGADGLPLVPVPVQDCPPGSVSLPSCDQASPGELCEGDGQCGTRRAWCWGFGDNNNRKRKLLGGSHNVLIVTSLTSLTGKLMRCIYWQHFSDEWNPWNYQLIPHTC